jgi:2-methylcitrate dehydratase PrpD
MLAMVCTFDASGRMMGELRLWLLLLAACRSSDDDAAAAAGGSHVVVVAVAAAVVAASCWTLSRDRVSVATSNATTWSLQFLLPFTVRETLRSVELDGAPPRSSIREIDRNAAAAPDAS